MGVRVAVVLLAAGCGRVGFATGGVGSDGDVACSALLCEDFESGLGRWSSTEGPIALDSAIVHTGEAALQISSSGANDLGGVGTDVFSGVDPQEVHLRAWFYIPSGYELEKINLLAVGNAGEAPDNEAFVFLVDQDEPRVYSQPAAATVSAGVITPRDRWFCAEIHVLLSTTAGSIRLDLDSTELGRQDSLSTTPTGALTWLSAGVLFQPGSQGPSVVYVDDLVADTLPIGCH